MGGWKRKKGIEGADVQSSQVIFPTLENVDLCRVDAVLSASSRLSAYSDIPTLLRISYRLARDNTLEKINKIGK